MSLAAPGTAPLGTVPPGTAPPPAAWGEITRLSLPTIGVAFAQGACQAVEVWLVGRLGTEALAGYALVLPLLLLLQMMSTGAMGGGVASAIARALGAGRREEASALVKHAVLIGLLLGLVFTVLVLLPGPALFRAMGGQGAVLAAAVEYAGWLFAASVLPWFANTLAAVLRGAGNMRLPARIMTIAWAVDAPLSGLLMHGAGPFAGLGLKGAAIAYAVVFLGACLAMAEALRRGAAGFRPRLDAPLDPALFRSILSVGLVASCMALLANLTTVLVTALATRQGPAAIAAYGVGLRLEFLMVPLAYGIGAALTALVGRRVGAGAWGAARVTAWRGGLLACGIAGLVGLGCAALAGPLATAFAPDAEVRGAIRLYLSLVAPAFAALGLGMSLYFASQGAGRMAGPLVAALARIAVAAGGGWLAMGPLGLGLAGLFGAVALGLVAYGALVALSVRPGVWR